MICDVPISGNWLTHLTLRLEQATGLGLLTPKISPAWHTAKVFVPAHTDCAVISDIEPTSSLRALQHDCSINILQWLEREDLFSEASHWMCTTDLAGDEAWLVCEAGYSKLGDKVLQERPHVAYAGRPLLKSRVNSSTVVDVATTLRWGRSWRFLGVVVPGSEVTARFHPATRCFFICDAFDGDSLVVTDFTSTP